MKKLLGFFRAIIFEDASFFGHAGDKLIEKTVERGMYPEFQRKVSVESSGEIVSQDEVLAQTKQYVREIQKERMTRLILGFCLEFQQHYQLQTEELTNFLDLFQSIGIVLLKDSRSSPFDPYSPEDLHLYWLEFLARADQTTDTELSAIFSTRNGSIGIGPRSVLPEDKKALIQACRVPLVLRRDGVHFRLVGPCYVSGIMQGEAVSGKEGTSFELVSIV